MNKLKVWEQKYAALAYRERWMVFFAGLVVVYALMDALLLSPTFEKQQYLQSEIAGAQEQLMLAQQEMTTLEQSAAIDVDANNKQKIKVLDAAVRKQKVQLAALNKTLVLPEDIPDLLKNLMRNYDGIRLVNMETLPPNNFLEEVGQKAEADKASTSINARKAPPTIFQHGLELTFSGSYMELMQYAEALQEMSDQVLWDKAVLKTGEYPLNELTVTVYTLSLDKTWLSF